MDDQEITQQIEPVRRTFLDVLIDNLNAASRVNYVHRLIYIGEHSFTNQVDISLVDFIQQTVQTVNNEYHDELLSGVLVYYPRYFCHILEGSEDSIIKHLLLLTENENYSKYLLRMKILICYHHINQRFLPAWVTVTGKPPTLLERIDINIDMYRTWRHIYNCIQKLYKLASYQRPKISIASSASDDQKSESGVSSVATSSVSQNERLRQNTNTSFFTEKYSDCLPEYGLIEFLLSTPFTADLETYTSVYGVIPQLDAYKDKVWPVPTEFVPFYIFDKPYDPVTDLPTAASQEAEVLKDMLE